MRRLQRAFCAVLVLLFIAVGSAFAQNSNIGTEFWTGWIDHVSSGSGMVLYIASDVNTTGTVDFADGTASIPFTVQANVVTLVDIPANQFLGDNQGVTSKGIHITSLRPIAVYAHIYQSSVSGATVLLPVNALANDYYSVNYTQLSNSNSGAAPKASYSTFMVVATEDNTTIEITPSADLLTDAQGAHPAGTKFQVTLQKGQIYQGLSNTDLTGTHVTSVSGVTGGCKRIAMFSGSSKIYIGKPNTSSDNLFQQAYPTASWGKNYITVPLKVDNYDVIRVVLSDATAVVKVNGSPITAAPVSSTLVTAGNCYYYEFKTQVTNSITSDKPIQVVQYAPTQGNTLAGTNNNARIGDPEMIYLNSLEQNIDHVTLYSTNRAAITAAYINVVIPTSGVSSFLLDGVSQSSQFTAVSGVSGYSYAQLDVSSGGIGKTHNISSSQGFNAIAYGFGSAESYGYSAGTNVKNLNDYVQFLDPATQQPITEACNSLSILPQIVLEYPATRLIWNFGDSAIDTIKAPVADRVFPSADGTKTLYQYSHLRINYTTAGTYSIKVTATVPITTQCGSDLDIYQSFTIVDPPAAKFSIAKDSVCISDQIKFTDQSDGTGNPIKSWNWKFGDGDTSAVTSPTHLYKTAGNYVISLTVTGTKGCSTVYLDTIHVRALPVVDFTPTPVQPVCEKPLSVIFTDKSATAEGKIIAWLWDFGDNSTDTAKTPKHIYKNGQAQPYQVTLTVITDNGCSNTRTKPVTVNYTPTADFNLPDACEKDNTHFTAISSITDSTSNVLKYEWTFGDPLNTSSPNSAIGKSVLHHFKGIGSYKIHLTVTSMYGCVKDTTKTIYVNGGDPRAAYNVVGGNQVCGNQSVIFMNKAYVNGGFEEGKVTSFMFDFGDGTPIQTLRVDSGKTFTHNYPVQYTSSKTYHTSMLAYSGATCASPLVTDSVIILPIPKTIFNAPAKICENGSPLQLADYVKQTYTGAPAGKPVFYIDNIRSIDGVLNPIVLGAGKHALTCYYIVTATGCADTTRSTITVEPIASVKAGKDIIILAGQTAQLKPNVLGGSTNTYLWTPTTGLSNPRSQYPTASPLATTVYKLTVTSTTDSLACPVSDSLTVTVLQPPVVPNAFTPNGDSNNDTWYIKDLVTYPGCTVEVFTRQGERVFYSVGYAIPWDGRYNGVNLPVGTYYYIIDPKNGRSKISGYVTIIR